MLDGVKVTVGEEVLVAVFVGVLGEVLVNSKPRTRFEVAVESKGAVEVPEGVRVINEVDLFVGNSEGAGVWVGIVVCLDPPGVEVLIMRGFVAGGRVDKCWLGKNVLTAELVGTEIEGAPCVRLKLIKATAETIKRKPNPNIQRARTIYPCRKRKFASRRLA